MLSKQWKYVQKMKRLGRCVVCGKKAVNKSHCETHRKYYSDYSREYKRRMAAKRLAEKSG